MPKKTDDDQVRRSLAIQEATKEAARVPLTVMERALEALLLSRQIAKDGNVNSISDAGVSALAAKAAIDGAALNVKINLTAIDDQVFVQKLMKKVEEIASHATPLMDEIQDKIESRMSQSASSR